MTVHLYTVCWNEDDMLGFFFRHYDPWVDRYIIFDDDSTDGSLAILAANPKVEIRRFERTTARSFCLSHQTLQNEAWKESRRKADWVVVTAIDEHLHVRHRSMKAYLADQTTRGVTILPALGFDMHHPALPDDDGRLVDLISTGRPRIAFNKLSIFDPNAVEDSGFYAGRHKAAPVGHLVLPARNDVMLWHFKHLGFERTAARERAEGARLGTLDIEGEMAGHYRWSESKRSAFWRQMEREAVDLASADFQPDRACVGPLWWSERRDMRRASAPQEAAPRGAPLVSVLLKSFNHARFVRQAVQSVLDQSLQDFEILITDDGSTDASATILGAFDDPRVHLQVNPRNLGIWGAMNATLSRARGTYLAILNSDDWALPERFERQVGFLEANPHVDAVFALPSPVDEAGKSTAAFNDFGRPLSFPDFSRRTWLRHFFYEGNCLCAPTAMIRRDAFDSYDRRLTNLQDLDLWVRLLLSGWNIHVLNEELSAFRIHDQKGNMSARRPDTEKRVAFETSKILWNFLCLDARDLEALFGEDAVESVGLPVAIRLAQLAFGTGAPSHQAFALDVLYEHAVSDDDFDRLRDLAGVAEVFGAETTEKAETPQEESIRDNTLRRSLYRRATLRLRAALRISPPQHARRVSID